MRKCGRGIAVCLATAAGLAQGPPQGVITTVAGTDWIFPRGSLAGLDAPIGLPTGLILQPGNGTGGGEYRLVLLDYLNHSAFHIEADGRVSPLAGNGLGGFSGDSGPATAASLLFPRSIAAGASGHFYIADSEGRSIRQVAPSGAIVTTLTGAGGGRRAPADGVPIAEAQFSSIVSLAVLPGGELAIADDSLHRIFRMSAANGTLTRIAGNGACRSEGDGGEARDAGVCFPDTLAVDAQGNLYFSDVADTQTSPRARRIRRIAPGGRISAFAGNGTSGRVQPGIAALDSPMQPFALAVDATDGASVLIASSIASTQPEQEVTDIARVTPEGLIATIPAPEVARVVLTELASAPDGAIYAAASLPGRVFRIGTQTRLIAGNGRFRYGGDGGDGRRALLNIPVGLALDSKNNLYVADVGNNRVRRLGARDGIITTVAGSGFRQASPPEPGTLATRNPLSQPFLLTADSRDRLHFSSAFGLHRLNEDGTSTVEPYAATNPGGLAFSAGGDGSVIYADRGRGRLLRGRPSSSSALFSLDTIIPGAMREGTLSSPFDVAADGAGNVYVSEWLGHRVLRIDPSGALTTFAGNGRSSTAPIPAGPRPATSVALTQPSGLAVDATGNLLIRSYGHVSRVTPAGELEVIAGIGPSTLGSVVFGDGGLATESALGATGDVVVDPAGNIYFTEVDNNRIRKILAAPPAFHASPGAIELAAVSGGAPSAARTLMVTGEVPGLAFAIARSGGGEEESAWLRVSAAQGVTPRALEVSADPAWLSPGIHESTILLAAPLGRPRSLEVKVRLEVSAPRPASIDVDRQSLTFTYPKTASRREQGLLVSNPGSGPVTVEVSATGGFLDVSPVAGVVTPAEPLAVTVAANPGTRLPGLYRGMVTIRGAGVTRQVAVTMTISDGEQAILLSQTGLSFQAVAGGGGMAPPQSFGILNLGHGTMPWRLSASTLSGGADWLAVDQTRGATDSASRAVPSVDIRIDQRGLAPGVYHGLVRVDSDTAANSPQLLPVFLEVLEPEARPGGIVQPETLTFTGVEGQAIGSQELTVYNLAPEAVAYRSSASPLGPRQPLQYAPIDAEVDPRNPQRIVVQPQSRQLPPGAYRSSLALEFADGTVRRVGVNVVIRAAGAPSPDARLAAGCAPKSLIPSLKSLGQAASVPAGWPAGVLVEVTDDCGAPMADGSVVLNFSNGDPPLVLQSLADGRWQGTWVATSGQPGAVTVRIQAENAQAQLKGEEIATADLRAAAQPPSLDERGVLNAPLAPGGLITLSGARFTVNQSSSAPPGANLPDRLGDTELLIAGRRAPLFAAGENRIQALVPFNVNANTRQQLVVRRGSSYSHAVPVNVASVQPAITPNPESGSANERQALARVVRENGESFVVTRANPARPGDQIVLYCSGLGAVDDPLYAAGTLAAESAGGGPGPAPVRVPVTVRVAGIAVTPSRATLAPGQIGQYQIGFRVPDVPAAAAAGGGDGVEVVLESQGQVSGPLRLALHQQP